MTTSFTHVTDLDDQRIGLADYHFQDSNASTILSGCDSLPLSRDACFFHCQFSLSQIIFVSTIVLLARPHIQQHTHNAETSTHITSSLIIEFIHKKYMGC